MTKQELKMVLKLIDSHTDTTEYTPCHSSTSINASGIAKLKQDLIEVFGETSNTNNTDLV